MDEREKGPQERDTGGYNHEIAIYCVVLAVSMAVATVILHAGTGAGAPRFGVAAFAVYAAIIGVTAATGTLHCVYRIAGAQPRTAAGMAVMTAATAATAGAAVWAGADIPILTSLYESFGGGLR